MTSDDRGRGRPRIGEQTAFTLPAEWLAAIDDLAGKMSGTRSAVLRLAVREYLARHVEDAAPELAALLAEADTESVRDLRLEDVDLDEGVMRLRSVAGTGPRHIAALPPALADALRQARADGGEGPVFPGSAERWRRLAEGER